MSLYICAFAAAISGSMFYGLSTHNRKYHNAEENPQSPLVKEFALRLLKNLLAEQGPFSKRIQGMIDKLPENARTVDELVKTCLGVVSLSDDLVSGRDRGELVLSAGTNDCQFIHIAQGKEKSIEKALPWLAAREICHILKEDYYYNSVYAATASIAAAAFACLAALPLLPSIALILVATGATMGLAKRRAESRADDFANQYCEGKEVAQALICLEDYKKTLPNTRALDVLASSSLNLRIASIRASYI